MLEPKQVNPTVKTILQSVPRPETAARVDGTSVEQNAAISAKRQAKLTAELDTILNSIGVSAHGAADAGVTDAEFALSLSATALRKGVEVIDGYVVMLLTPNQKAQIERLVDIRKRNDAPISFEQAVVTTWDEGLKSRLRIATNTHNSKMLRMQSDALNWLNARRAQYTSEEYLALFDGINKKFELLPPVK